MNRKTTKYIPLLVRSGQWQVIERTEEHITAVRPKNRQDDQISEQKKLIDQLTKKMRSQDKQIKTQDIRIGLQDEQIKEMNKCIRSQNEQIRSQTELITALQARWESHEEQSLSIDQNKEIARSSNGRLAILMADTCKVDEESFVFGSKLKRKEISAIYTQNTLKNVPSDAWDVSAEKNGSVMAWTCKETEREMYIFYLAGDGDIYANPDSSYLFAKYENLIKADFSYLKTDMVTDMSFMFYRCIQLQALDVSNWNVSKVRSMDWMFCACIQLQTLVESKLIN